MGSNVVLRKNKQRLCPVGVDVIVVCAVLLIVFLKSFQDSQ